MRTRFVPVALASAVVLAAAGCSSGSSSHNDATAAPTTASTSADDALTAAVRAYSAAYFKPDPAAGYALLSARCQTRVSAAAYGTEVEGAVATYGHQQVQDVTVDQLSGDLARVSYTYTVPALDQSGQPWAREGGAWRYDAC